MPTLPQEELLKHAVRRNIWLPACQRRLEAVRQAHGAEAYVRYFTFSNGDALDPIFLYIADVLEARAEFGPRGTQGLTSVHFFDRSADNPQPVLRDLPGAKPFGGSFIETVLFDPSSSEPPDPDSHEANQYGVLRSSNRRFRQYFPFDIINFDWNDLLLDGSNDPNRLIDALRRIFQWQREGGDQTRPIDAFTLSIALRKPEPAELSDGAAGTISSAILLNMQDHPRLRSALANRCGANSVESLAASHWNDFVELGIPKLVLTVLDETGWVPDPAHPLQQIVRPFLGGAGTVQQLIIELVRGTGTGHSTRYAQAVEMIFAYPPNPATMGNPIEVGISLRDVYARRDIFRDGPPRI